MNKTRLRSKKGFSLPFAIAITTVLILLSASLIAIAATSIVSTSSTVNSRQAYLNVRSALQYAYAYYSDSSCVEDLSTVNNEYMAMKDKDGGTVEQGAFITTKENAEKYTTYVVAVYTPASATSTAAKMKLTAYSKSSDAFGKRTEMVHLSAVYTINNMGNKNRVTLTDVDMNTDVSTYAISRDAISLHLKQYPGEEWNPFYYVWTYKDEAELYSHTNNCYSLEELYYDQVVDGRWAYLQSKGNFKYTNNESQFLYFGKNRTYVKKNHLEKDNWGNEYNKYSEIGIVTGFNINEDDTNYRYEPASVWNVVPGNSSDPRNGTTATFTPSAEGGGWFDTTYYIRDDQVNYFNLILTTKGKVLWNTTTNSFDGEGVQTNEMFHLWFLHNGDRNIYFEFLKPGLVYTFGTSWNGHSNSDDRYIAYVNNRRTTVHLKVKGVGNSGEAAYTPATSAPMIRSVMVNGKSLFDEQTYSSYANFSKTFSQAYYSTSNLESRFNNMFYSADSGEQKAYFYSTNDASHVMLYEGCGWWVANIPTTDTFKLQLTVYDMANKAHRISLNVNPSTKNEAYIVCDFSRSSGYRSFATEVKAMEYIGEDMDNYVTVSAKTSEIGTPVAPYLDYQAMNTSLSSRRELSQVINSCAEYNKADFEEASYAALETAIAEGTALYNDLDYIANQQKAPYNKTIDQIDQDYKDAAQKIKDAIRNLKTATCDSETYQTLQTLLAEATNLIAEHEKDYVYEPRKVDAFKAGEAYTKPKEAIEANAILKNEGGLYTTTYVRQMITNLSDAVAEVRDSKLDKTALRSAIDDASFYTNNSRYDAEQENYLQIQIDFAENLLKGKSTEINGVETMIPVSIKDEQGYADQEDLDETSTIQQRIDRMVTVLEVYVRKVTGASVIDELTTKRLSDDITAAKKMLRKTPKENCTDETYTNLQNAFDQAEEVFKDANAEQADYEEACDTLEIAMQAFEVLKPGLDGTDANKTTDVLSAEGIRRLWFQGLNVNTEYVSESYKDIYPNYSGEYDFHDIYTIQSFDLELFYKGKSVGFISSDEAKTAGATEDNLCYIDIQDISFDKYTLSVEAKKKSQWKYGSNWYDPTDFNTEVDISFAQENTTNIGSNNLITIKGTDLKREYALDANGSRIVSAYNKQYVSVYSITEGTSILGRLSEVFFSQDRRPKVTLTTATDNGDVTRELNLTKEGNVYVTRFMYEADQTMTISHQIDHVMYTYVDNSKAKDADKFPVYPGQYLIAPEKSSEELSTYTILLDPLSPLTVNREATVELAVQRPTGEAEMVCEMYLDEDLDKFACQLPITTVGSKITARATYTDAKTHEEKSNTLVLLTKQTSVIPGCNYEYNITMQSSGMVAYSVTMTGDTDYPVYYINPTTVYPQSNKSGSSAAYSTTTSVSLDGLVAADVADKLVIPTLSSSVLIEDQFDYFAQAGTQGGTRVVNNIGFTVIWIEKEVYESSTYLDYHVPYVYVWDMDQNPLNGEWPGRQATRVAETNYFYTVVPANCYGCILSIDTGRKDSHGNPIYEKRSSRGTDGNIYFDDTDIHQMNGYTLKGYSYCSKGVDQGFSCLYQIIDTQVLDGTYSVKYGGKHSNGITYYDQITYSYYRPKNGDRGTLEYIQNVIPPETYNAYNSTTRYYLYRAKSQDTGPKYYYEYKPVDKSGMTKTDLRMAFVGGDKIRITNKSYHNLFSPVQKYGRGPIVSSKWNSQKNSNAKEITSASPYGGNGGNQNSMGRVGGALLSVIYDWYERKIPVDSTDQYTIQIRGLRLNGTYIKNNHKEGKVWSDSDYDTDNVYTIQLSGLYGDVWVKLNNVNDFGKDENSSRYSNITLYTQSPENAQVQDNQPVYFAAPSGWSDVTLTAMGVGGSQNFTLTATDETDGDPAYSGYTIYKTTVPGNKPFLTFSARRPVTGGSTEYFQAKTAIQGNDRIMFNPTYNLGTGGWTEYVPPVIKVERELYKAHSIYYGSVKVKQYDDQGYAKNLGDAGSYEYAKGIGDAYINSTFFNDGIVKKSYLNGLSTATLRSLYTNIHDYVTSYSSLYGTMAKARAYIPKSISGQYYPEYLHAGKPKIYDEGTIQALNNAHNTAMDKYINSTNLSEIKAQNTALEKAIDSVTISTDDMITVIYFDTKGLVRQGSTFKLQYQEKAAAGSPVKEQKLEYYNTEGHPITFVKPAAGESAIYNARFVVNNNEYGEVKDKLSMDDSAWVYMDLTTKPLWVLNSAADYRDITMTTFKQPADATFTMNETKASKVAGKTEKDYRPITLYFRKNVTVTRSDGTSYPIMAGAYSFEAKDTNTVNSPFKASTRDIVEAGVKRTILNEAPKMDLYSVEAQNYFSNPAMYGEYSSSTSGGTTVKQATEYSTWVDTSVGLGIKPGAHNVTDTVNMTVNTGEFSASRVWSYITTGKLYFRWASNDNLMVKNNVNFSAKEITFASSGIVDATQVYNKHMYFTSTNGAKSMTVIFPTDITVQYYDKYRDFHSFTIREGKYTISKATKNQNFVADLCDEEYWTSMEYVEIDARYESEVGMYDSKQSRLSNPVYEAD